MGSIKVLPDTLISQIAAGEVVERPASVVKEFLENSLDAGATMCRVEIEQGGAKLIAVRDNGSGMSPEDAAMAFARHATSKISRLEDLNGVRSYGFRGEALAAIASVAMVTLRTRLKDGDRGTEVVIQGGKFVSRQAAGCPSGTEIVVRNLFFNTPARRKFLKSESAELAHIAATVNHMALAHPQAGFELFHNGQSLLSVSPSPYAQRVAAILGKSFFDDAMAVSYKTLSIVIRGFIGRPGMALKSKRHQYLFVNGRDVGDSLVSRAVADAYGSRLPGRMHPVFVLHVDTAPGEVDVNVHPRKLTVKFLDAQRVYRDVSQAVAQALDGDDVVRGGDIVRGALEFSKDFLEPAKRPRGLELNQSAFNQSGDETPFLFGQIADSYLLIADEQGLAIVDQHAAHERILYEQFKSRAASAQAVSQPMLVPHSFECTAQEGIFLQQAAEFLTTLGFEFDQWSGHTVVIRACPASLKTENLQKVFRDFLDDMVINQGQAAEKILPEKILKSLACKAAVKFGMPLSPAEQRALLNELRGVPNNATCPHGRPTRVLVTFEELERRFYRRK